MEGEGEPYQQTAHLFRRKYGEMMAALLRSVGTEHFGLAEEAVQAAFLKALEKWPITGTPDNPAGWLYTVARNALIEALRREKREHAWAGGHPAGAHATTPPDDAPADLDDLALMIFLCCTPALSAKAQVCLTLKAACGFSVGEIARAFGMKEEAVKKTITRAKKKMAEAPEQLRALNPGHVTARFSLVLETLYALFSEGYAASRGDLHLRRDVVEEAVRLGDVLLGSALTPAGRKGELQALRALMMFQCARLESRTGRHGEPVRLQEQDRSRWNTAMIAAGLQALRASQAAETVTAYHLEARIAAEHAVSPSFAATRWEKVLGLYDQLLCLKDTPEVRLNRIVAVRYARGAGPAYGELALLPAPTGPRAGAFLYEAVRGDLLEAVEGRQAARAAWERALHYAPTAADRVFVKKKLRKLS